MRLVYSTLILILPFFQGCNTSKKVQTSEGNSFMAIKKAIDDFLHSSKLVKRDSVFYVRTINFNENILGISITGATNKIPVVTENEIDYGYDAFPTKFYEENGKLFYWRDSTQNISLELINKLSKMNLIDTVIIGKSIPKRETDDSKKAAHYYFCKQNLYRYKKIYTNIAMGFYNIPEIKCDN